MEEENGGFSGSDVPISSRPSSTQGMPPFDEGKLVDGMSAAESRNEWDRMTRDVNDEYRTWPRSVFLKRRDRLHERGFSEQFAAQKEAAEVESKSWLEAEIERIAVRDDKEERGKLMSNLKTYFGGEKEVEAAVKSARGVLKRFAKPADLVFLDETKLGNDPELIQKLAEIGNILQRGGKKKK
jgi:hypothetical protein